MQVVLYKTNKKNNLYYYSVDDRQQSLFHPFAITVRWGSTPDGGRERHYYFETEMEKNKKIRSILKERLKQYQVLYSYFRDSNLPKALPKDILIKIS